ncbi:hypothetical protein [Chroococcidiopsis sp.]|uniref:hypothetical protein n=1 Tax=Chroococcidiopsis sp. TaxID=3088168 RepID=UPI003F2AB1A8
MPQKFPYEKASIVIAEAEIFGDKNTLARWGINQSTLWRWRDRRLSDPKLHENALLKTRMLLVDWQTDATRTLKTGLLRLNELIPQATANDAATIHAIAGACKIIGELKIASDALSEPAPYQSSERS